MIEIFDTVSAFDTLKPDWQRLEASPKMRIFQTWLWCRSAWHEVLAKEKGNRLWLLKWSQDGRDDVVICPFYIDGSGCLRFLFDTHSDVCDCVYGGDAADLHWAFKEIAETIRKEPRARRVWLQKLDGQSAALNYLGVFCRGAIVNRDNAYSWVRSEKCEDFIAGQSQMKSKDKADLKAIRRKGEGDVLRRLSAAAGAAFPRELAVQLRDGMVAQSRCAAFLTDDMLAFIEKVYAAGGAEVLVLEQGGAPVALNFLLKKGGRYLSWVFLYADPRTSSALYVRFLSDEARQNAFTFDFGVGVYDYKIGTFRPQTALTYSLRYGKSLAGCLHSLFAANLRFVKDIVKAARSK